MSNRLTLMVIAWVVTLGSLRPVAGAVVTFYSDPASFAAVTNTATSTFEGDAPPAFFSNFGTSHSEGEITFQSTGTVFAVSSDYDPGYDYGTGTVLSTSLSNGPTLTLTITLPAGTTAFGLDFGSENGSPDEFTFSTGDTLSAITGTPRNAGGNFAFLGFTSPVPVTYVTITADPSASILNVDNVAVGQFVPEPSTFAIILAAVAGLWVAGRARVSPIARSTSANLPRRLRSSSDPAASPRPA